MGDDTTGPTVRVHELKTWPDVFDAVWNGHKTAEFRRHDRDFRVGDTVELREWSPETKSYSGRRMWKTISHIAPGGRFGIPEGFCMLSLKTPTLDRNGGK